MSSALPRVLSVAHTNSAVLKQGEHDKDKNAAHARETDIDAKFGHANHAARPAKLEVNSDQG